jgi:hypothetical protein
VRDVSPDQPLDEPSTPSNPTPTASQSTSQATDSPSAETTVATPTATPTVPSVSTPASTSNETAGTSTSQGAQVSYQIVVTTGNVRGAGTDANVFVQLFGDQGETAVVTLPAVKGSFESGKTDVFTIQAKNVGTVNKLRIGYTM